MRAHKLIFEEIEALKTKDGPSFSYLAYAKFCATSAVTGGPVEEMNGIPIPAQLVEQIDSDAPGELNSSRRRIDATPTIKYSTGSIRRF